MFINRSNRCKLLASKKSTRSRSARGFDFGQANNLKVVMGWQFTCISTMPDAANIRLERNENISIHSVAGFSARFGGRHQ
jgi:hypothetical protein